MVLVARGIGCGVVMGFSGIVYMYNDGSAGCYTVVVVGRDGCDVAV